MNIRKWRSDHSEYQHVVGREFKKLAAVWMTPHRVWRARKCHNNWVYVWHISCQAARISHLNNTHKAKCRMTTVLTNVGCPSGRVSTRPCAHLYPMVQLNLFRASHVSVANKKLNSGSYTYKTYVTTPRLLIQRDREKKQEINKISQLIISSLRTRS